MGRNLKDWYRYLRGDADVASLCKNGMRVGKNLSLQPRCIIDRSHCWLISIGDDVTIAPNAIILAHDASTKRATGYTRIGLVNIGDRVFIGAGSVILPGVTIGHDSIIGGGSVVSKDIPPYSVAVGSPARVVSTTRELFAKADKDLQKLPVFSEEYTISGGVTVEKKTEMISRLMNSGGRGFVR